MKSETRRSASARSSRGTSVRTTVSPRSWENSSMSNGRSREISIFGAADGAGGAVGAGAADGAGVEDGGDGRAPLGGVAGTAGAAGGRTTGRDGCGGRREPRPASLGGYFTRTGDGSRPTNFGSDFVAVGGRRGDGRRLVGFPYRFAGIRV